MLINNEESLIQADIEFKDSVSEMLSVLMKNGTIRELEISGCLILRDGKHYWKSFISPIVRVEMLKYRHGRNFTLSNYDSMHILMKDNEENQQRHFPMGIFSDSVFSSSDSTLKSKTYSAKKSFIVRLMKVITRVMCQDRTFKRRLSNIINSSLEIREVPGDGTSEIFNRHGIIQTSKSIGFVYLKLIMNVVLEEPRTVFDMDVDTSSMLDIPDESDEGDNTFTIIS